MFEKGGFFYSTLDDAGMMLELMSSGHSDDIFRWPGTAALVPNSYVFQMFLETRENFLEDTYMRE